MAHESCKSQIAVLEMNGQSVPQRRTSMREGSNTARRQCSAWNVELSAMPQGIGSSNYKIHTGQNSRKYTHKNKNKSSNKSSTNISYNQWMNWPYGRSYGLLKYSQNQRFTTNLESLEGSQCEPRFNFSDDAKTLSLDQPVSVCRIMWSLRTILNHKNSTFLCHFLAKATKGRSSKV